MSDNDENIEKRQFLLKRKEELEAKILRASISPLQGPKLRQLVKDKEVVDMKLKLLDTNDKKGQ